MNMLGLLFSLSNEEVKEFEKGLDRDDKIGLLVYSYWLNGKMRKTLRNNNENNGNNGHSQNNGVEEA